MRYDTTRRSTLHYAGHYRGEDRSTNRKENRERGRRRQRIVGAARHLRPPVRRGRGDVRDRRSPVEAANNSNLETRFQGRGACTGERRDLQMPRVLRLLVEVGLRAAEGRQGRSSVLSRRPPGHRRNLLIPKLRARVIVKRVLASDSRYASRGRDGREARKVQRTPHRRESFLASPAAKLRAVCRVKSYTVGCRNLRPKV